MPADTHEQRIGNMAHQTDDAPQTESAEVPGLGPAKPQTELLMRVRLRPYSAYQCY